MLKPILMTYLLCASALSLADTAFSISSSSIVNGQINPVHACTGQGGEDQSPALQISNVPSEAKYLAIIIDDPDANAVVGTTWVHWNVFNVPAQISQIKAGVTPKGEVKISSSGGKGYEGMCPPAGTHRYRFAVFALKNKIDADGIYGLAASTIERFNKKFKDDIIAQALIEGKFTYLARE